MTQRKAATEKILILGVDGLDPRLTRKYVDMGIMPSVKEYIERGACRHDLVMLGGHPTITPPMWTTLATGANPNVHGIADFARCGREIDQIAYNLDSRLCKAEQVWNVLAEDRKKTLVWHWPGSSWPPSSDSPNLMVVDGTTPGSVGMGVSQVEAEFIFTANEDFPEVQYLKKVPTDISTACVITDLELDEASDEGDDLLDRVQTIERDGLVHLVTSDEQHVKWDSEAKIDIGRSPIEPATKWADAPADAKEFTLLLSGGAIRRPCLILKNDEGIYDRIAIYKNKKAVEPLAVCPLGEMVTDVIDESIRRDTIYQVNRNFKLLRLDEEGKNLSLYVSAANDITNDSVYSPKRIYKEIVENVGYPKPTSMLGQQNSMLILECMLAEWETISEWQAKSIQYLIEAEDIQFVFSHYHAVDICEHKFIKHLADRPFNKQSVEDAEKWMKALYAHTDSYLGKFLHYLDEGWTIIILSDHAQVASAHEVPNLMESTGICTPLMEEIGLTYLNRDENGKVLGIDWTKTLAVMSRSGHLYLNIKGRDKHTLPDGTVLDGLIDPADQYEMEEAIITKLYQLTSPETGHRIVSIALRNRDAILLGQGGPEAGDIFVCDAEGYNFDHGTCLSTTLGECDTSVSPIFIAAGSGIKEGYTTDRVIRETDVAPTVSALAGVRMPAQCEGAPVYQILEEEF